MRFHHRRPLRPHTLTRIVCTEWRIERNGKEKKTEYEIRAFSSVQHFIFIMKFAIKTTSSGGDANDEIVYVQCTQVRRASMIAKNEEKREKV